MPDLFISAKVPKSGSVVLKTVIFIFIVVVLLLTAITFRSDKNKIFDDIKKVKIGMTRTQAFEIVGSPKRNEKAPFAEGLLLSSKIQVDKNNTDAKFLQAVQRDRYELYWFTSSDKADIYNFDVYYDAQSKVCYLNLWQTGGWLLIE